MGTNYYHRTDICPCCSRYEVTHICKSHITFEAIVQWNDDGTMAVVVSSWAQWKDRLRAGGEVWNEYREIIPTERFIADVEATDPQARRRQYDWLRDERPVWMQPHLDSVSPDGEWLDADGFSFSGREFS